MIFMVKEGAWRNKETNSDMPICLFLITNQRKYEIFFLLQVHCLFLLITMVFILRYEKFPVMYGLNNHVESCIRVRNKKRLRNIRGNLMSDLTCSWRSVLHIFLFDKIVL